MILFNITCALPRELESRWLRWTSNHYIPTIEATQLVQLISMYKILDTPVEYALSYVFQLHFEGASIYHQFILKHPDITEGIRNEFGEQIQNFSSVLKKVER